VALAAHFAAFCMRQSGLLVPHVAQALAQRLEVIKPRIIISGWWLRKTTSCSSWLRTLRSNLQGIDMAWFPPKITNSRWKSLSAYYSKLASHNA
jgi:hypothetical protein